MEQVDVQKYAKEALESSQHLESLGRAKSVGVFREDRLSSHLARHAKTTPRRVALVSDDDQEVTYAELLVQVEAVADLLHRDHGIAAEQVVTIHMSNSVEFVMALMALNAMGATACIVDHKVSDAETREIMRRVNSSLRLINGAAGYEVRDDPTVLTISWPMQAPTSVDGDSPYDWNETTSNFASTITFSSGSTALPKAMLHSDATWSAAALVIAQELDITKEDVLYGVAPYEHGIGLLNISITMLLGARLVVQRRWSASRCLERMQAHHATFMYGVPTMLHDLVTHADELAHDGSPRDLSGLRLFHLGGSGASPNLRNRGEAVLGCPVTVCYGSMEALTITLTHPGDQSDVRFNSEGIAVRGQELRFNTPSGTLAGEGEITTRGPSDFLGYLYGVEGESFDPENWIGSGDVGKLGEHSELHFVARKKQIIIRGGLNVSPNEIERCLELHPDIEAAGVVGVPSARLGEQVCVCLVMKKDVSDQPRSRAVPSIPELREFLSVSGVGAENAVDFVVAFSGLPATVNGKIARAELRDAAVERLRATGALPSGDL